MNGALKTSAFQTQRPTQEQDRVVSNGAFTSHRVIVPQNRSPWFTDLKGRLDELTSLPVGWDGYAGQPVSFHCAFFVANMLERLCQDNVPAPSLVPGSDGSLQVEWHRNQYDVELDVLGPQNVIATRLNLRNGKEEEIEIQNDFSEIVDWIAALADDAAMTK